MRPPSISSSSVRVAPQQERSARRLAGFLQAAAELFSEIGFEATTMQAIADRNNSSIGALYNYFPDKQSIATTLLSRYAEELHWRLKSLMEHSETLSTVEFAGLFIDCIIDFAQERPAYLNLHGLTIRFRRDPAARKALREIIANAFRIKNPSLSSERSLLAGNVAVQIVKGMINLYLESDAKTKPLVVAEFRRVLTSYLEKVLSDQRPAGARR
ncbi:MAG: TetR/AcrR family transcriptional regulator [Verrucomicrobia bacterium]|nr:TetR/AcrR family transcriptional regulator [Verrucomicrobiota bacterium]